MMRFENESNLLDGSSVQRVLSTTMLSMIFFSVVDYFIYSPGIGIILSIFTVFLFALKFALRQKIIFAEAAVYTLSLVVLFFALPGSIFFTGGARSPVMAWYVIIPVGALFLFGINRNAIFFTGLTVLSASVFIVLDYMGFQYPAYNTNYYALGAFLSYTGLIIQVFLVTKLFKVEKNNLLQHLEAKQALFLKHAAQMPGLVFQLQIDKHGKERYLFLSDAIKDMMDLNPVDVKANPALLYNRIHPEDLKQIQKTLLDTRESFEAWNYEARVVIPGKPLRWVKSSSRPERIADGSTVWYGYIHDITEEKKAELALMGTESIFRQITSTINDTFFLYDTANKKYLYVSPNCKAVLGVDDTYFYEGKNYTVEYVHPEDRQRLVEAYNKISEGQHYELDYRVNVNGKTRWLNEKSYMVKDSSGAKKNMSGIVTDITDRKISEAAMLKSQQAFEEAQQLAHIGSWEHNFFEEKPFWSKEMYRIVDILPDKDADNYAVLRRKLHPADLHILDESMDNLRKSGIGQTIELRLFEKNGGIKYLSALGEVIRSKNTGKIIGMRGTIQDITKQKLAALAKSNFLSTMSHEIRTPINGVIGITNLLMEEDLTAVQKEYVNTLNFSAQHLSTVVSDILDFSKIESGTLTFEKLSFNLEQVCSSIFKLFESKAAEKNLDYRFRAVKMQNFSLYGDYVRLSQILTNLLSNAVKFTQAGSVEFSYHIVAENDHTVTVAFVVKDAGIGIPLHQQKRIFESFLQADESVTRQYGGTGLGLTISKRLVELQGGKISLESEHRKGSVFTVEMTYDKHSFNNGSFKETETEKADKAELKGMKILVAEDNKVNALVITRFLNKWGIESKVTANGQEAIDALEKESFNAVLMDLQMPVMGGRDATAIIRKSTTNRIASVPVIALTADALLESQLDLLKNGFNDCVTKPFSPEGLFKILQKYYRP
jgi:PAS domain S-box-containing protein